MVNLEEILSLLKEKRELLQEFENATIQMIMCDSEELHVFVKKRSDIIEKVDELDKNIEKCLAGCDNEEQLRKILGDKWEDDIPEWADEIYNELKNIKAVLSRIGESDVQASSRLLLEKEKILEHIKDANGKSSAKATKFYASSGKEREKNISFGNA